MNKDCETCRHDLGGGYNNCRINLESECAAGNYEAWEPKKTEIDFETMSLRLAHAMASSGVSAERLMHGMEELKIAMQQARRLYNPRHPRIINVFKAKLMLKKNTRRFLK